MSQDEGRRGETRRDEAGNDAKACAYPPLSAGRGRPAAKGGRGLSRGGGCCWVGDLCAFGAWVGSEKQEQTLCGCCSPSSPR